MKTESKLMEDVNEHIKQKEESEKMAELVKTMLKELEREIGTTKKNVQFDKKLLEEL